MTSKLTITDERLAELVAFKPLPGTDINSATRDEWMAMAAELHERRKAERDSEPVAWQYRVSAGPATGWSLWHDGKGEQYENSYKVERRPLYRHAQPAPERDQVRIAHAEWSQATFGNVGPVGPLKHLSKEALEAAEQPGDLSEWADMQFLLWDAQRRAGITDDQITQAMIEKLAVNKQREWPEPKDGEPRLHIKEQPAPVVPDRSIFEKWWKSQNGAPLDGWDSLRATDGYCDDGIDGQFEAWNAAMLQELKKSAGVSNNCRSNENLQDQHVESLTTIKATPDLDSLPKNAESRSGNSPVIPEGYVMVPMRLTAENGAKGVLSGEFSETQFVNCPECFGDDECETCDGSGRIEIKVPVSWTTIKEIWIKGVEYFAAAPQENN